MGQYGREKARELAERARKNSGGGKYVKLSEDGDEIKCAFLGEVYASYEVWNDDTSRSEEYNEEVHGPEKEAKPKAAFRWNLWDMETRTVRVFKQGTRFFGTWTETTDDLESSSGKRWWYKIKRKGKPRDPATTYSLTPFKEMTEEEFEEMKELVLHDLSEEASNSGSRSGNNGQQEMKTANGMKADRLNDMIALAKQTYEHHPGFLEDFFARFDIKMIRDVPPERFDEAFEFIRTYGSPGRTEAPPATADPFAVQ